MRLLFLVAGWINMMLGVVGALLPLMPTTIFLLIAVWCFARSSPHFEGWLYEHEVLGPPLRRWRDNRIVPISAKILATLSILLSLAVLHGVYPEMVTAKWVATAVCLPVIGFLLSRQHIPRGANIASSEVVAK